jgi:hypothetical protein
VTARNDWLVAGAILSGAAAALHLAVIAGGPEWYRFFGAGEAMALMAAEGRWYPAVLTFAIAAVLAAWAAYALAGAGLIGRLPLMRTALVAITAIYLMRGLVLILIAFVPAAQTPFNFWSSLIVLGYGTVYAVGTARAWPLLSRRKVSHALGS